MVTTCDPAEQLPHVRAEALLSQIRALRQAGDEKLARQQETLDAVHPDYRHSADNLLRYLAVRRHDIRPLQRELATLGLSSLGLLESHVSASLDSVANRLADLALDTSDAPEPTPTEFTRGARLLSAHAEALLDAVAADRRRVPVMVTLPSDAACSDDLINDLLDAGMAVARINCAHDDADAWLKMVQRVRVAAARRGRICRIQADLAGPKSRTGPIQPAGRVLKLRPRRDFRGRVLQPARLWLSRGDAPVPEPFSGLPRLRLTQPCLPDVRQLWLMFEDARNRVRMGKVVESHDDGWLVGFERTCYIEEGCPAFWLDATSDRDAMTPAGALAGAPEVEEVIRLRPGDTLTLTRAALAGRAARLDEVGVHVVEPARLHCTLEAAFDAARAGHRVWLDDGRIGGTILGNDGREIRLRITHASPMGSRIRAEKGINFPDTDFAQSAMTAKDLADLSVLADSVDIIALSFVRRVEDVHQLQAALRRILPEAEELPGVVLKIENRQGFERLPELLLAGMRNPRFGVMVARGDLAVELGFDRLAEVQEEILWLCEAAHVPVIWATQILESMAKSGAPSRPEVTDAAMSVRAECVMLNKGPHIVDALRFLVGVLDRMEGHMDKRMAVLRPLSIAGLAVDRAVE